MRHLMVIIAPHTAVVGATVGGWIKGMLDLAGIDKGVFSGHSTRSAEAMLPSCGHRKPNRRSTSGKELEPGFFPVQLTEKPSYDVGVFYVPCSVCSCSSCFNIIVPQLFRVHQAQVLRWTYWCLPFVTYFEEAESNTGQHPSYVSLAPLCNIDYT